MDKTIEELTLRMECLEKDHKKLHQKVNMLIVEKYSNEIIDLIQTSNITEFKSLIEKSEYPIDEFFSKESGESHMNMLLYSAELGKEDFVGYLLGLGAKVNVVDKKENWNSLMYAIEKQNGHIVGLLLEKKIEINNKDVDGFTPLSIAIDTQNETMVRMILQQKPNEESIENVKMLIEPIENYTIRNMILDYFGLKNEDLEKDDNNDNDNDDDN